MIQKISMDLHEQIITGQNTYCAKNKDNSLLYVKFTTTTYNLGIKEQNISQPVFKSNSLFLFIYIQMYLTLLVNLILSTLYKVI
jgi:hypothetical protein